MRFQRQNLWRLLATLGGDTQRTRDPHARTPDSACRWFDQIQLSSQQLRPLNRVSVHLELVGSRDIQVCPTYVARFLCL